MTPEQYNRYTQALVDIANNDERIYSLIALGSTAKTHHQPDEWSDHDFWYVVADGTHEAFHNDLSWIPNHERIVLAFRETQHGWKVIFDTGHVLEYAIFQNSELEVARFHHYDVLVDKTDIQERLHQMEATQHQETKETTPLTHAQHLLSLLVIGMGRYHRGEKISGMLYIKHHALEQLHELIQATIPAENPELVDDLSPSRRLEWTHPKYAQHLHKLITASVPDSAEIILDIVLALSGHIPDFPYDAVDMVFHTVGGYVGEK